MDMRFSCLDGPERLRSTKVCLTSVSKDLQGNMYLLEDWQEECRPRDCRTLKVVHLLHVQVEQGIGDCDSLGGTLDGRLYANDLVHAFADGDSSLRGVHTGTFHWAGLGARVQGIMSGISNAGTHRAEPFDPCQRCHDPGWMEGRLCGSIVEADDSALIGCQLLGAYRLRMDGAFSDPSAAARGTIEGVVLCSCDRRQCTDFQTFQPDEGPNPRVEGDVTFTRLDSSGSSAQASTITTTLGVTGLDCSPTTEVQLPAPATAVTLELAFLAEASATVSALLGTTSVPVSVLQTVPGTMGQSFTRQTLAIPSGAVINRLTIEAANARAKLLNLCFEPIG